MEECKIILSNYGPVVIAISGAVAAFIAIVSILSAREIAKKKNAIDLIIEYRSDHVVRESIRKIAELNQDKNTEIGSFAYEDEGNKEVADKIMLALNYFEMLSVGITQKVYHEHLIKRSMHRTLTQCFISSKPFIENVRRLYSADTIYFEFETLAKKWIDNPLKVDHVKSQAWWKFW